MRKLLVIAAMSALVLAAVSCKGRGGSATSQTSDPVEETDMSRYIPDLKPGDAAPDFEASDTEGNPFKLSSLRGKYVLLDFWASWCGDCRAEIPAMKDLFYGYGAEVEFVSFSFDHEPDAWKSCLSESGMQWTQVSNLIKWHDNPVSAAYGIHWIPTMFLINPEGKVSAYSLTAEGMKPELETQLSEKEK